MLLPHDVGELINAIKALVETPPDGRAGGQRPWAWLSDANQQRTLAFIGAGIVTLIGGAWTIFTYFVPPPLSSTAGKDTPRTEQTLPVAAPPGVARKPDVSSPEAGSIHQHTEGAGSPAIAGVKGNVTVTTDGSKNNK